LSLQSRVLDALAPSAKNARAAAADCGTPQNVRLTETVIASTEDWVAALLGRRCLRGPQPQCWVIRQIGAQQNWQFADWKRAVSSGARMLFK
jgi:hypothetical protein